MSRRHSRNRKDQRGKTPEQLRRGQAAHEARYELAIALAPELDPAARFALWGGPWGTLTATETGRIIEGIAPVNPKIEVIWAG